MKYYTRLNTADGIKAVKVEGRKCPFLDSAFTYKDEKGRYNLIDTATGLAICFAGRLKDLEGIFLKLKNKYDEIVKSPKYKTQKHNFEALIKEAEKDA